MATYILNFQYQNMNIFRDENDIYVEVPITITEAVLGCKKEVPTLFGNVMLTIPAGSESGEKHRIKGKGINNEATRKKGDMYIVLKIVTPKKLTREQKQLLDELSKTNLDDDNDIKSFTKFVRSNEK